MTATVLQALLDVSIRAAALGGLVAATLAAIRVRSASARHAAWTVVMLVMLTMPALQKLVPELSIPAVVLHPLPPPVSTLRLDYAPAARPGATLPAVTKQSAPATRAASRSIPPPAPGWPAALVVVYSIVAAALLLRMALGVNRVRRLIQTAQPLPASSAAAGAHVTPLIAAPLTAGVIRPRILLPSAWTSWPADKRQAVLIHEEAHVRRRDPLILASAGINRCLFWFHPLAWWLERQLACTAEHACDAAALRQTGAPRRYAEVLVELADAVRIGGGRVKWHALGIDGTGLIGQRVDRILAGNAQFRLTVARRTGLTLACAAAVMISVACRQQVAPGLLADPVETQRLAAQQSDRAFWNAAARMTPAELAAAEAAADANHADLPAMKRLLIFYQTSGQRVLGWNELVRRRRARLLRTIAEHPESELAAWRGLAPRTDAAGYSQARALWLQHIARSDASPAILSNAALFFQTADKPLAEQALLRARAIEPNGPQPRLDRNVYHQPWSERLGTLYALSVIGSDDDTLGNVPRSINAEEANGRRPAAARRVERHGSAAGDRALPGHERRPDIDRIRSRSARPDLSRTRPYAQARPDAGDSGLALAGRTPHQHAVDGTAACAAVDPGR